jgi:putative acetyltransferase
MLRVVEGAFSSQTPRGTQPVEVGLTRALVEGGHVPPQLELVAIDGDEVVGVVIGSVGRVGAVAAIGLGPVAVTPDRQSTGVGSQLVSAVVGAADDLGFPLAALLGDPGYYARFGFVTASDLGVIAPDDTWGVHFQARRLSTWTPTAVGPFRYAEPFDDL